MNIGINGQNVQPLDLEGLDPFSPANADILRFPFSNDAGLDQRFAELQQFKAENPYTSSDAALLIGNGSLLSLAGVLPETVYVTDYSISLLAWMNNQIAQLAQSEDRFSFTEWLYNALPANRRSVLKPEFSDYEAHSFLRSDETYNTARAKILGAQINFVHVNYADPRSVRRLGRAILDNGNGIRVANFTNVHARAFMSLGFEIEDHQEGVKTFLQALEDIPFTKPAAIIGSSSTLGGLEPLPLAPDLVTYKKVLLEDIKVPVSS
ncbi:MAG: hypothetical protein Q7T41_02665 [Candidatus Saccharibacteria bacterium]|nr:hypothetical protein [Candidatus Saccharibacteria bacterium]